MTNFTVRAVRVAHQFSTVPVYSGLANEYVELLIIGNPKFKETIRGRKFILGDKNNPFDDCIVYLGRLLSGGWITDDDYENGTREVFHSWRSYDSETDRKNSSASHPDQLRKLVWDVMPWSFCDIPVDLTPLPGACSSRIKSPLK